MNCCFTGHRSLPRGADLENLKVRLREEIENAVANGYDTFIAGGAVGFDMLAGFTVIDVKKRFPNLKLIIMLPCPEFDKFWDETSKKYQRQLLSLADSYSFVSKNYYKQCMFVRNRAMVDNSTLCVAYYNESNQSGGTAQTLRYAREQGKNIVILPFYPLPKVPIMG